MSGFNEILAEAQGILETGLNLRGVQTLWQLLGGTPLPDAWLSDMMLSAETLPKALERPFTEQERLAHFLWATINPLSSANRIEFISMSLAAAFIDP